MKFRHHCGIRLALTSGHITYVGTHWQTLLPVFHAEALARGCQCEQHPALVKSPTLPASAQAVKPLDESSAIAAGITALLKQGKADHFSADGLPDIAALSAQVGFSVEKDHALAVWRQMQNAPLQPNPAPNAKPSPAKKRSNTPKASTVST